MYYVEVNRKHDSHWPNFTAALERRNEIRKEDKNTPIAIVPSGTILMKSVKSVNR